MRPKTFNKICNFCVGILMVSTVIITVHVFSRYEIAPGARPHFAYGQIGATGATGPTGPKGATGSASTFNNHVLFSGAAPTLSNCGVNPTDTNANDNAGTVSVGKNSHNNLGTVIPVLQCTLTFATAFTGAPAVSFGAGQNGLTVVYTGISTTGMTVYFSKDASQQKFSYSAF